MTSTRWRPLRPKSIIQSWGACGRRVRQALTDLMNRFGEIAEDLDDATLTTLADELASVAQLLTHEVVVTRYLVTRAEDSAPRIRLLERLLSDKVGDPALEVLRSAVSERWSDTEDLIVALQHIARQAFLVRAERAGQIDEVADQLFWFSRILDEQPHLAIAARRYDSTRRKASHIAAQCHRRRWQGRQPDRS